MKTTGFRVSLLTIVLVCAAHAPAQSRVPEDDAQNWNDIYLTVPMNQKLDFVGQLTLRLGDTFQTAVDERWGMGFNYKVNPHLTVHEFYFNREARPPNGRREHETRITFGATVQAPIGKFTFSDRSWFEHRWRDPQVDSWRYRNRVRFEHPFTINKSKFNWFVSDEVFYDWSLKDWVRNRAAIGANHAFSKHITGELYYLRQNDGRARPGDLHIIGTQLRIKL